MNSGSAGFRRAIVPATHGMALCGGGGPRQQPQERMISFSHGARRGPPAVDTSRGRSSAGRSLLELADQDLGGVDEHAQRGVEVFRLPEIASRAPRTASSSRARISTSGSVVAISSSRPGAVATSASIRSGSERSTRTRPVPTRTARSWPLSIHYLDFRVMRNCCRRSALAQGICCMQVRIIRALVGRRLPRRTAYEVAAGSRAL